LSSYDIGLWIAFIENANAAHMIRGCHGCFNHHGNWHRIAILNQGRDIKPHTPFAHLLTTGEIPQGRCKPLLIRPRWCGQQQRPRRGQQNAA
jgi:hypothetical protein